MPNFGWEEIGDATSAVNIYNYGTLYTCPNNGTVTSISAALTPSSADDRCKVAIYDSSKNLLSYGELNPIGSTDKQFYTISVTPVEVHAGSDYYLSVACADKDGGISGTGQLLWTSSDTVYSTIYSNMSSDKTYLQLWEDPWTNDGTSTRRRSIYASYETTTSSSSSTSSSTSSTTTVTSTSTTSTSSSTTSTSSSTTSTSSSTSTTTSTSTSTTVPYLKFSVGKVELPLEQNDEVLQLNVELVK